MDQLKKTVFFDRHVSLGARMVEFGGWNMPIQYPQGIVHEHLATRKHAGLFDVSHMGRFIIAGRDALPFLQYVLTNNAAALDVGKSHYTIISNERGGAVDDSYLYRFTNDEYLLVVNASNRDKDWAHFRSLSSGFENLTLIDRSDEIAMVSLQGPASKEILSGIIDNGHLPEPGRNSLSIAGSGETEVMIARTGYTGEPLCFELFIRRDRALAVWNALIDRGAQPVGLGARDTLRLEAALPLYGHELGTDPEGNEIPIFAIGLAKFAISFSELKGDYVGKAALEKQFKAFKKIINRDYSALNDLPQRIKPVAVTGKGIARAGARVFRRDNPVGWITSGTMVPHWLCECEGILSRMSDKTGQRAICLALLDSTLVKGDNVDIEIRNKKVPAVIVPYHMRSEAVPCARAITYDQVFRHEKAVCPECETVEKVRTLIEKAVTNTIWRQQECINLIPSEMTPSPITRILSIMDTMGRYAEHKQVKAFLDAEVFYYQGTDFIAEVEVLLENELCRYLGCADVETRVISGQMANTAVFSAMVDYVNRADRKLEPRRIRSIMNHHIIKGGHLSAQPMGALRDYVARNPRTESESVVHFPVLEDNPYKIDTGTCHAVIAEHRPELIILGKSMIIHREPVAEIRAIVDELSLDCIVMYDMAHVLGLIGPHFQEPFREGVDIVTGSTHKTYFGTQRGIIGADYGVDHPRYPLWETIRRRAFPGSVSNHHLGTMLGLLMAAYEMNWFKDDYQRNVIANAKAFARALKDCGLNVAGDPSISYTETHQVIVTVGYARGPEIAHRLEENNIIVNYQTTPKEESFSAAGALRLGVAEMTRFGMTEQHFGELAEIMADVILRERTARDAVRAFRKQFLNMKYCFPVDRFGDLMKKMHKLL